MSPTIVGVLDLMNGVAVRAVGGRREEYRPVHSRVCNSSDPRRIAEAFREQYGIESLYVADLDAILGRGSNSEQFGDLSAAGFRLTVDAGLRHVSDAGPLLDSSVATIVAGLETLDSPEVLAELTACVGASRLAFSLDLAGGRPLLPERRAAQNAWRSESPVSLALQAADLQVEHLIVLDLHAVGEARGPVTETLCQSLREALPDVALWTGGGVRSMTDVRRLGECGADAVLVATALHDGVL